MSEEHEVLSDRNIAAFLSEGNPEAEEASRELLRMIADPITILNVLKKLNINTEWMFSVLKSIAADPSASAGGRISALREMRTIARSAGLSMRQLAKHYKLEEAVADLLIRKGSNGTVQHEDDEEIRRIRRVLDTPVTLHDL